MEPHYKKIDNSTMGFSRQLDVDKIEVEIGDAKQENFFPRVKIKKWDNEVNFSVGLITHPSNSAETQDNSIVWSNSAYDAHFYHIEEINHNESSDSEAYVLDNGGFEFEFTLREKPTSNIITLSIRTKGLDFFYQPYLTEEEKSNGVERHESVQGSYAVYHKNNAGDFTMSGGKNYGSGKAFHIFRPHAKDSAGNSTYADINIDVESELLTITLPQEYLDSATYPVWVDPTIGYTTIGASWRGWAWWNSGEAASFFLPQSVSNNVVNSINLAVKLHDNTPAPPIDVGVYNGYNKVVSTGKQTISVSTTPMWYSPVINSTVSSVNLVAWIGTIAWAYDTAPSSTIEYSSNTSNSVLPNTLTRSNASSGRPSVYIIYGEDSPPDPEPITNSSGLLGGWF